MKKTIMGLALGAGLLLAQPPAPTYANAKAYLGLTDAQVTALQAVQTAERTEAKSISDAINTAQTQLNAALAASSPSAAAVGALEIQIYQNRAKLNALSAKYRTSAIAVLTLPGQAAKLAAVQAASDLAPTIREADSLNLITPPANSTTGGPGFGPRRMGGPGFSPEMRGLRMPPPQDR